MSKALEITVESSLSGGFSSQVESTLQQLLSTFLSDGNPKATLSLSSAISRLAGLLADDAPDTVYAAQRAVYATIASLKGAVLSGAKLEDSSAKGAGGSVTSKLASLDSEVSRQQAMLQKLAQTSAGAITREQVACARAVFSLHEQKVDALMASSNASSGVGAGGANAAQQASLKSLNELSAIIKGHLTSAKKAGAGAGAASNTSLAAFKKEEAMLEQQAFEVRTTHAQQRWTTTMDHSAAAGGAASLRPRSRRAALVLLAP